MSVSSQPATKLPVSPDSAGGEQSHAASWLAHVAAGRIGCAAAMSAAELATQLANERVVLGRCPSAPVTALAGYPGRG